MSAVLIIRTEAAAEESLADMRARMRFGIAIAPMIRRMATTMSNSINEKPFCFLIERALLFSFESMCTVLAPVPNPTKHTCSSMPIARLKRFYTLVTIRATALLSCRLCGSAQSSKAKKRRNRQAITSRLTNFVTLPRQYAVDQVCERRRLGSHRGHPGRFRVYHRFLP